MIRGGWLDEMGRKWSSQLPLTLYDEEKIMSCVPVSIEGKRDLKTRLNKKKDVRLGEDDILSNKIH